jgi:hypothetical protein
LLPALPKVLAASSIVRNLSPRSVTQGPPLPAGLNISWPAFFTRK